MTGARYAVASDSWGWHERQLAAAFARCGVEAAFFSLRECYFSADESETAGIRLPGFAGTLPDALFVRGVPGGSFEQVTRYLGILHGMELCGVKVVNNGRAIERTVDKAMTSFLLGRSDVSNVPSWTVENVEEARNVVRQVLADGNRLVQKPLFGSRGRGLRLIAAACDLDVSEEYGGVFYLQRFVRSAPSGGRDWRVFVIDGDPVAAMERRSESWITNRARGGLCSAADPNAEIGALAVAASSAVGAAYAGVDVIADADGKPMVLEVNGIPAWRGLQESSGVKVAALLVASLIKSGHGRPLEVAS